MIVCIPGSVNFITMNIGADRMEFEPSFLPDGPMDEIAWWFAFTNEQLLVIRNDEEISVPRLDKEGGVGQGIEEAIVRHHHFGKLDGISCYALELAKDFTPAEGYDLLTMRELFSTLDEEWFMIVGRAYQIMTWDRDHQFCGRCGSPTRTGTEERVKKCSLCDQVYYPRVSPAVIVAISRDNTILLARSSKFRSGFYSVLAGFVEPGESLEECVKREVMEEVRIGVTNIRYFGNQSWPFPHSLMIGFTAEYEDGSGEIEIDDNEILEADWFGVDELPKIPGRFSISRQLIDNFVASHR